MSWFDALSLLASTAALVATVVLQRRTKRAVDEVLRQQERMADERRRVQRAERQRAPQGRQLPPPLPPSPPPAPSSSSPFGVGRGRTGPAAPAPPPPPPTPGVQDRTVIIPAPPVPSPSPEPALPAAAPPSPPPGAPLPIAAPPPPPAPDDERWLRLGFTEPATGRRVGVPFLEPGESIDLAVSIGRESADLLRADAPFPIELLPQEDLELVVLVSSSDFLVTAPGAEPAATASGTITLRAETGTSTELSVSLTAPDDVRLARLRVSVFYRGALVQSVLATMTIDHRDATRTFGLVADYSATSSLRELPLLAPHRRLAILTNDNPRETHQIVLRHGQEGTGPTATFAVREDAVAPLIADLRDELALLSPRTLPAGPKQLREELRRLAPVGARLYTSLFSAARDVLLSLDGEDPADTVVQVARPASAAFTYPWSFLYAFPLPREADPGSLPLCPVVDELAGTEPPTRWGRCPHEPTTPHDGLLCPFGFWGLRYRIELPPTRARLTPSLRVPATTPLAVGLTDRDVDRRSLQEHLRQLEGLWGRRHPGTTLASALAKQELLALMEPDQPLVYMCCHGDQDGAEVVLGLGGHERLYADDLVGLVRRVHQDGRTLWQTCAPLVFLNCCGSLAIEPKTLVSYVDAFVGSAGASGVIGTEARVSQDVAARFAELVLQAMVQGDAGVGAAVHEARLRLLAQGSLVGLSYTPYCWTDLQFVEQADPLAA